MKQITAALHRAFVEAGKPRPNHADFKEAYEQLKRIDTNEAELAEFGGIQRPGQLESRNLTGHVVNGTPEGIDLLLAIAKLNGALHGRRRLTKAGKELKAQTTIILYNIDRIRGRPPNP